MKDKGAIMRLINKKNSKGPRQTLGLSNSTVWKHH
uniref:Uncharacterized protein n=1 Tax=Anguilla anguilla TaxID=7936 RepID=A0A0E9Q0J7_ANGAN